MEIKKEKLEQIINQSANPSRLEPEQIPELELYIDQILMLFEDKLGENRRRENDKILTKSMVNNYSKEKMIRPMRGKKYSREQILQILMICNLKNVLSIGDIKQVMTLLMACRQKECRKSLRRTERTRRSSKKASTLWWTALNRIMMKRWTRWRWCRCC